MQKVSFRIGQIVPSSNTTMEIEVPAMLRAREQVFPERFTFHSSRMRMKKVTKKNCTRWIVTVIDVPLNCPMRMSTCWVTPALWRS
jgi:maleate cis-trans isomerase